MAPDRCSCFARISRTSGREGGCNNGGCNAADTTEAVNADNPLLDSIVLRSSSLGNFIAPPWHLISPCESSVVDKLWEDPEGHPELTSKQKSRLSRWVRFFWGDGKKCFFASAPNSGRIKQGFVADCSFLSSLAALADYESRHSVPLLTNIIKFVTIGPNGYEDLVQPTQGCTEAPLTTDSDIAIGVKLYFNGIARCVVVDDWVPVRADGRLLCAHSSDRTECWVSILERAFVKLNGGRYTIRGTNPGIDIYHLTGWIPDIIFLQPSGCVPPGVATSADRSTNKWNDTWDVIYAGFCGGSCVVCLGTSDFADAVPVGQDRPEGISVASGIVSDHAYSMLDMKEVQMPNKRRIRLMYLKNPWGSISWTKRFSPSDSKSWTPEMQKTLGYVPNPSEDNGMFWIEWNDVLKWFSHLYVAWKPSIFRSRVTLHHVWEPSPQFLDSWAPDDMSLSMYNPQFSVVVSFGNSNSATLWLMLIQHRRDFEEPLKYLAMHVFSRKDAVVCPAIPEVQGVYNNGECILLKLIVKLSSFSESPVKHMLTGDPVIACTVDDESSVMVLVSYYSKKVESAAPFTIRALSSRPIKLTPKPCVVRPDWHRTVIQGEWTDSNSGGSPQNIWTYFKNPHYRLFFPEKCEAVVLLESASPLSVNLRIFNGRIATIRALKAGQLTSSDEYRVNCCSVSAANFCGHYVVIPSAYRASDHGAFRIIVRSSKECSISPLPYPQSPVPSTLGLISQRVDMQGPLNIQVSCPTLVSIRIKVPTELLSDNFALLGSSAGAPHPQPRDACFGFEAENKFFCLSLACNVCGGAGGRLRQITKNDPLRGHADGYDLVLYSDLNGGNSNTGRTPSASARYLFENERVINFTLAELQPTKVPYRLCCIGGVSRGMRAGVGGRVDDARYDVVDGHVALLLVRGRPEVGAVVEHAPDVLVQLVDFAVGGNVRCNGLRFAVGSLTGCLVSLAVSFGVRRVGAGMEYAEIVAEYGAQTSQDVDLVRVYGGADGVHDRRHDSHAADWSDHGFNVASKSENSQLGVLHEYFSRVVESEIQQLEPPGAEVHAQFAWRGVRCYEHEPE
ncbi:calpain family cysteine protease domain-containing protein [Babesia ovata]|uniref:Calpain family cysteine protease domain-containing protein n=1 Tax=Babesia ovata TaxID=189622 RepID=A0A2H6K719_9APIC|nr:calpain family cysteine protease domain-containing protein [Babesia ovata]GBE58793.1 calpain family cysteine protease domain-containing protein [Babesia ovata]